ncbi:hypothetical protein K491DRAFT_669861 [Lophiostoma macrostomum CBS 122681]|uniref:HAUS augmin-like complex subunit 3 N-terminal domain-containing protein n=1 Tax=Lophiostoma macrostomum CBS 122681 TaxID=1314788 RepID=A0A6A6SMY9_9PLEO|nr:hypothetical protein K491DRAFT_669861 [Lophiostoma macrostomum CBS 122681]
MAEEAAAHLLLNALEERNLHVDLDAVLAAFEEDDSKRETAAWVQEYLNEETLLTRQELDLYHSLKRKGVLRQFEHEDDPIRPILDNEVSSAIESLQSSTAVIEEQCKVLEAQRDALMALKALDKPNLAVEHTRNERRRKEHQEKARLDLAVDDAFASINEQLQDSQRDIDTDKLALKSYITERLASDDKILTALPGIVSKLLTEPAKNEDEESIEQWCNAIISFQTAEIKARVETVYLNSVHKDTPDSLLKTPESELKEQKDALRAELETLNSEIASVAEMVVEHELRKPLNDVKERKAREKSQTKAAWTNYVLSTLEFMQKRLDTIANHMTDVDEFHQTLGHISSAASARTIAPVTEARPTLPRRGTSDSRAAFPPVKLKPSKSLDLPPVLQEALRHAGVFFSQDSIESLRENLTRFQMEKNEKLRDQFTAVSTSMHDTLADRLEKAYGDQSAILSALYLHAPYAQVYLTDPKLEENLKQTDKELELAEQELLKSEASELNLGDPKVMAFVAKYGDGSESI